MRLSQAALTEAAGPRRRQVAGPGPLVLGAQSPHFPPKNFHIADHRTSRTPSALASPPILRVSRQDLDLADSMVLTLASGNFTEPMAHLPACHRLHLLPVAHVIPVHPSPAQTEADRKPSSQVLAQPAATLISGRCASRYP